MAETSSIEWTDATWNPVTGCSVVSPGCTNCYAMTLAGGRLKNHPSRAGLTIATKAGPVWNGQVRLNTDWLDQPLRWTRARTIFVCAHGDLFHPDVPDEWIDQVFAVMVRARQHTFQVLTKRGARMRAWVTRLDQLVVAWHAEEAERGAVDHCPAQRALFAEFPAVMQALWSLVHKPGKYWQDWPLPNVWLGVSAEDQRRLDERVHELRFTPAAVRYVSAEPLLGPLDFLRTNNCDTVASDALRGIRVDPKTLWPLDKTPHGRIDWVIAGGESGAGARPMHPDWARQIRDDCAAAGVAFHFKQWGAWAPREEWSPKLRLPMLAIDRFGGRVPDDVAPQDVGGQRFAFVGKKAAGRLLDGVEHNGMPEIRR